MASMRFAEGTLVAFNIGPSYMRQWFHCGSQIAVLAKDGRSLASDFPAMALLGDISILEQAEIFWTLTGLPLREEISDWDNKGRVVTVLCSKACSYPMTTL